MTFETEITPEIIQAYVTGTLDAETANRVALAAEEDAELAAELAIWRSARKAHADDVQRVNTGEIGWARLERAINQFESQRSANDNSGTTSFWSRRSIAPWQAAAAVALAILSWQAIVVPALAPADGSDDAAYVLAGEGMGEEFALRVAFAPDANAQDIDHMLRGIDARIVDGPSAIGLYTLAFPDEEAMFEARETLVRDDGRIVSEIAER